MPVSFACRDWLVLYSAGAWKGEGRRALGCPAHVMHGFSEQRQNNSDLLCSCAPSTTWEPLCSVAWTSEFHPAWCQGELVNLFQTLCLCCYLISLDLLVDRCSGFHWCDGGPKSRMSAVGTGVRERGWLSLGEVSFQSWRHTCLSFKGCFS